MLNRANALNVGSSDKGESDNDDNDNDNGDDQPQIILNTLSHELHSNSSNTPQVSTTPPTISNPASSKKNTAELDLFVI